MPTITSTRLTTRLKRWRHEPEMIRMMMRHNYSRGPVFRGMEDGVQMHFVFGRTGINYINPISRIIGHLARIVRDKS
jgi:hypothetical protein